MFIDGVKNSLGVGLGIVIISPEREIFNHYLRLNFPTTNNEAEYEGFFAGLWSTNNLKAPYLQ